MAETQILVVEDEGIVAEDIKRQLEDLGYGVTDVASSGEEAIRKVSQTQPDLVLMDIVLKGDMDGVEATERIHDRFNIPVVYLTANSDESLLQRAKVTQPYGYILKPFAERELYSTIETALYKHQAEKTLKSRAGQQEAVAKLGQSALSGISLSLLMDQVVAVVAHILRVDLSEILELLPAGKGLMLRAGLGWKDGLVGKALVGNALDSQVGYTLRSKVPVIVEDLSSERRFSAPSLLYEHGVISGVTVVIPGWEQPFGVLGAHTTRKRVFTEDDTCFLQAVANVLAEAIERTLSEEALRGAHNELEWRVEQRTAELMSSNTLLKEEIAERKRAENELREQKEILERIFEHIPVMISFFGEDGRLKLVNREFERVLGWSFEEIQAQGLDILEKGYPDPKDREVVRNFIAAANGEWADFKTTVKSGQIRDMIWANVRLSDGTSVGIGTDTTERNQDIEALRNVKETLQTIFDAAPVAILGLDLAGRITNWSSGARRMFGWTAEETIGRVCPTVPKDGLADFHEMIKQVVREGPRTGMVYYRQKKSGRRIHCSISSAPLRDVAGKVVGVMVILEDITELKRHQEELRRSEAQYRELVENINDILYATDEQGVITYISQVIEYSTGLSVSEIIGHPFAEFIHPEDLPSLIENFDQSASGHARPSEFRIFDQLGKIRWLRKSSRPVFHGDRFSGTRGLLTDITERKQAEEERLHLLQRIVGAQEEEQRRLSRELHDQLGQSIAALLLGLKSLDGSGQFQASGNYRLHQLQELTNQLARDVHQLASKLRPTALDDLGLHTALSNYTDEWSERSKIPADFHSNGLIKQRLPPQIETTVYRIVQEALTNVLKHAEAQNVSIIVEHRGNRVLAIVEDDGRGFEAEAMMDKPVSERRLGLLGMQERVALVDGKLNIESAPGAGTTVLVHIPVADQLEANPGEETSHLVS